MASRLKLRSKWRRLGGRRLEQLHRANVERVAAYLSLEQMPAIGYQVQHSEQLIQLLDQGSRRLGIERAARI